MPTGTGLAAGGSGVPRERNEDARVLSSPALALPAAAPAAQLN